MTRTTLPARIRSRSTGFVQQPPARGNSARTALAVPRPGAWLTSPALHGPRRFPETCPASLRRHERAQSVVGGCARAGRPWSGRRRGRGRPRLTRRSPGNVNVAPGRTPGRAPGRGGAPEAGRAAARRPAAQGRACGRGPWRVVRAGRAAGRAGSCVRPRPVAGRACRPRRVVRATGRAGSCVRRQRPGRARPRPSAPRPSAPRPAGAAGRRYSALTAATRSARPALASAKSIPVLGLT